MKRIKLILASLFFVSTIFAQKFGEIHGTVLSEDNKPVISASVYAEYGGQVVTTITDLDGKFKLKPLTTGVYLVKITSAEFSNLEIKSVNVNPDEVKFLGKLTMTINELETITVIAHKDLIKKDNPSLIPILAKDIKTNAAAKNINGLLTQLPGITGGGTSGQELYFRGSRPQSINTYVDGVKLLVPNLANIPSNAIKSVNVYTGGVPAAYGDITGGVIILETKSYMDFYNERFN